MRKRFKVGDEAIAECTEATTGYTCGNHYKVISVRDTYIEICTDYGRYEKVPALFFTKG